MPEVQLIGTRTTSPDRKPDSRASRSGPQASFLPARPSSLAWGRATHVRIPLIELSGILLPGLSHHGEL